MKTMAVFVPKQTPEKSHEDIFYSDKRLRIIYYKNGIRGISFFIYKLKTRKFIKNCEIFQDGFSHLFKGRKIYHSGHSLVFFHIVPILKMISPKTPISIFSSNPDDIDLLSSLLMTFKNVGFVTTESMQEVFSEKLLGEFGITGAVASKVNVFGKTVIIMPGGEVFSPEGAETVINLSKNDIPWKSLSPENISFNAPKPFKSVSHFIRQADIMETVLNFFELDFSSVNPVSVKINKQKHN